jgi:hypothetical protein
MKVSKPEKGGKGGLAGVTRELCNLKAEKRLEFVQTQDVERDKHAHPSRHPQCTDRAEHTLYSNYCMYEHKATHQESGKPSTSRRTR